jgi:hypothetical protein
MRGEKVAELTRNSGQLSLLVSAETWVTSGHITFGTNDPNRCTGGRHSAIQPKITEIYLF